MILDLGLYNESLNDVFNNGFGLLHYLRWQGLGTDLPVIIHTADLSPDVDVQARSSGVFAVFRKGEDLQNLLNAVREALVKRAA